MAVVHDTIVVWDSGAANMKLCALNLPDESVRASMLDAVQKTPTARHRPILGRLLAGDGGILLVERRDLETEDGGVSSNWDVLNVTGELMGRLRLPRTFTPQYFRSWRIYGFGSESVPQLVRYDIVR
jgi:hypothetical protein